MIKQIHISQLKPGMYLHRLGGAWMEHPFWRKSFLIKPGDLQKIVQAGIEFAYIDTEKGADAELPKMHVQIDEPEVDYVDMPDVPPATEPMPIDAAETQELDLHEVNLLCLNAANAVEQLMTDVRMGRSLQLEECLTIAKEIVDHVLDDASAMIMVVRLKNHDERSYMHSVAVCALMIALARELGFNRSQMEQAGLAGLVHDVGKSLIPLDILNKPGKLTPDEYRLVQTHAVRGHALLSQSATPCPMALDVCLHHHERLDGSGYPYGLKADRISLFAKMGAICDVYDALTSERPHKPKLDPATALRVMAQRSTQFDQRVFQAFVKAIGIYPIGSVVRLESQLLGVVTSHERDQLLRPTVKVFYSLRKQEPIMDPWSLALSREGCTDHIVGIEASTEMHVLAMEMI